MNMRAALADFLRTSDRDTALASIHDILIGLDEKITFDANGQVNGPPGQDAVLIMDISNPSQAPHPSVPAADEFGAGAADQLADHAGRKAGAGSELRGDEPGRRRLEDRTGQQSCSSSILTPTRRS